MDQKSLSLEKQKELLVRLLEKLIIFLDANNLNYTLAFGTLIGAVRHKGFIPWDDDIDIAMPFKDYQKMIEILKTQKIGENIGFSCHQTNPDHLWAFGKVYDTTTKLDELIYIKKFEKRQQMLNFGLYIDVFPIYPVPDEPKEQLRMEKKIKANYKHLTWSSRKVVFPKGMKHLLKKFIYELAFIPYRLIGIDYYLEQHDRLISEYVGANTNTVCSNVILDHFAFFDKSVYENTTVVPFESIKARIPVEYDVILKKMYGDYMTLPPEDKRRTHTRNVEYR